VNLHPILKALVYMRERLRPHGDRRLMDAWKAVLADANRSDPVATARAARLLNLLPTTEQLEAATGAKCDCGEDWDGSSHYPSCPLYAEETAHWNAAHEAVDGKEPHAD
jgi:hypothetical protein